MEKLKYDNDWECDKYSVNGKQLVSLRQVKIGDEYFDVFSKEVSVPYNDMGHTYHGTSIHHFIEIKLGSQHIPIDLNRIVPRQAVYAVDYVVEGECPKCGNTS